ncbi:MAG: diphosphomevalonate decarboxylase [Candidatus Anstonellales archaeon]
MQGIREIREIRKASVIAPTNIALIKYWGKMPERENDHFPTKSSLSITIAGLYTKTNMKAKKGSGKIYFTINGKKAVDENVRAFFEKLYSIFPMLKNYDYKIDTKSNFPIAAGFASSASGFAALAHCLAICFKELNLNEKQITAIARLGSGSASRSATFKGGFVLWNKADKNAGVFDSYAKTLFKREHWKDLRLIYIALSKKEKKIKSRAGMKQSINTCPFYWQWVEYEENILMPKLIKAIKNRDFDLFSSIVNEASNNFHAICLATKPAIHYLNDKSFSIMDIINDVNEKHGKAKACYTFDAGPNPIIITKKEYLNEIFDLISKKASIMKVAKIGGGVKYS